MRARSIAIGAALAMAAVACGGSSPTAPTDGLTQQIVTEHFVFHYSPGDAVNAEWAESRWLRFLDGG